MAAIGSETSEKSKIRELANTIAEEGDCDVMLFNFGFDPGLEHIFFQFLRRRRQKRKNLLLILTTEGGDANTAYRIARWLQDTYDSITILVAGWCKSAGTLVCIAANKLLIADTGELGPLDVQIAKADEIWERSSGLVVEAAFEKLQEESFKLFFGHLMDIKEQAGRITFKTAADIAAQLVVGQTREIFAKIEPLTVGEDYRSNLIAEQYAIRLNLKSRNLIQNSRVDGLRMLLRGYPSHRFIIDRHEAAELFREVEAPTGKVADLAQALDADVLLPRSSSRQQKPRLEYLNAEVARPTEAETTEDGGHRDRRGKRTKAGAKDLSRRVSLRASPGENGSAEA
mgnify:CR=1 FL=1